MIYSKFRHAGCRTINPVAWYDSMQKAYWLGGKTDGKPWHGDEGDWHFLDNYQNRSTMAYVLLQTMHLMEHLEVLRRCLPAYDEGEKKGFGTGRRGRPFAASEQPAPRAG